MLDDQQIRQFQFLYQARFGKEISQEEALAKGIVLMRLVELTYKPMTEAELEMVQKRREEIGL